VSWSIDTQSNPGLCSVSGTKPNQSLSCGPTDLAAGASFSVHITAMTSAAECTVYDNTATASSTNDGGGTAEDKITCQPANITITKTADQGTVSAGSNIGFTLTETNTGAGTAHGVVVTDTLPSNPGTSWTVDGGTAAATCSISAGVLTCNIGNLAPGASATEHLSSPTTAATCGTVNNTGKVTTTNDGSGSSSASVGVTCPTAEITPTNTSCQAFSGGTSGVLGQINYTAPAAGGTIAQNVNPGVFFYWDKVTAPAGTQTYTLTQSATPTPPALFAEAAGSGVFDANCSSVSGATVRPNADGSVTIQFNAGSGGSFFIGIKYSAKSIAGATVGAGDPTFTYTFGLVLGGNPVAQSGASVKLVGSPA
jgi:uncharacterized repeat protein (TIGR01451 family)